MQWYCLQNGSESLSIPTSCISCESASSVISGSGQKLPQSWVRRPNIPAKPTRLLKQNVERDTEPRNGNIYPACLILISYSALGCPAKSNLLYHCTVSNVVAFFPRKNHREPIMGPANAAMPWKPWLKFRRAAAYRWLPRTLIYEFAATSSVDNPHPVQVHKFKQGEIRILIKLWCLPITKVHPTNPPYFSYFAEGQKKIAPAYQTYARTSVDRSNE